MPDNERLRFRILSKADTNMVHQTALKILDEIGIQVEDEDTRKLLKEKGCGERENSYTTFSEKIVEQALSTVPQKMVLYNQDGEVAVDSDDDVPHFCSGINCLKILDAQTGEHRPCLLSDVVKSSLVSEQLPHIDMVGSLGTPSDVPAEEEAVITVKTMTENTKKPIGFTGHDEIEQKAIWTHLADLAGGWQQLADKPFGLDLTGPTSPLQIGSEACRRLRFSAKKRLPSVCYPGILPGFGGPLTIAGSLAQSSAEILAGIVIHQLEQPGAPVVSGSAILPLDMRNGNLAYGSTEYSLACQAAVDYFTDIGVPSWIGAGCTDAHQVDAQAASEAGMNMLAAATSGSTFIHNLGYLSSGNTGSLEMLVLADELAGIVKKTVKGVLVNDETLAFDVVKRAAEKNAYVSDPHTFKHMRTELWIPSMFARTGVEAWQKAGAKSALDKIREKIHKILGD
jgi:trimethylamine---corrinoid protein Co-methyltransferase